MHLLQDLLSLRIAGIEAQRRLRVRAGGCKFVALKPDEGAARPGAREPGRF